MTFILELPPTTFIDLIGKAFQEDVNDKLWEKWLHEQTDMSFDQYKAKHQPRAKINDEEVLQDAENILKMMSKPN